MKRGFTLIEFLIVLVIVSIIFYFGIKNYISYQRGVDLEVSAKQIADALVSAQNKSINREKDKIWGVYFKNGDTDFYEIYFTDSNYSGGTTTTLIYLPKGVEFSEPAEGQNKEIQFEKNTGRTTSTSIKLVIKGTNKNLIITTNSEGKINLAQCPFSNLPQKDNIVAFWQMEEESGTIIDQTEANNGTYNGVLWQQTGKIDKCLGFDGTDDNVNCGTSETLKFNSGNFTMVAWIKTPSTSITQTVGGKFTSNLNRGYMTRILNTGKFSYYAVSDHPGATTVTTDTWHMVAVTVDSSQNYILYLDGANDGSGTSSMNAVPDAQPFRIGTYDSTEEPFNGLIDEYIVWNTVLTANEVSTLYANGAPERETYIFCR